MYFNLFLTKPVGFNENLGVERHQRGELTPLPLQIEHWLLLNMNWLGVLCKKLAGVKDCVIVKKVNLGGLPTGRGRYGKVV